MTKFDTPYSALADHASIVIHRSSLSPPLAATSATDGATWDYLFDAVIARLRLTIGEELAERRTAVPETVLTWVQTTVGECIDALEQLRLTSSVHQAEPAASEAAEADEIHSDPSPVDEYPTTLPNRSFFRLRLDHALMRTSPKAPAVAVLCVNFDGFKSLDAANANGHGIDADTDLLNAIELRLMTTVGGEDMVSHMGGDDFACLLTTMTSRQLLSDLACKLLVATSAPLKIGRLKLTVCPSIGIAVYPADGATADSLIKSADAAMYRAKRDKTGYAFFGARDDRVESEARVFSNAAAVTLRSGDQFQHSFSGD